jgi:RNA polymerase sigma-70 factor (ECF subfamily)
MHRRHPRVATPASELAEAACLAAIAAGDVAAFERLYRALYPRLFRFVLRVTGRLDGVEDVLSETMLAVWRGAAGYRGDTRASAWVFGIAYRQAVQALRRRGVAPDRPASEPADSACTEAAADAAALRQALRTALAALPADQRAAVDLTFYHGCSCGEVAAILGCPVGTVKSRMFQARMRLRPLLARLYREST